MSGHCWTAAGGPCWAISVSFWPSALINTHLSLAWTQGMFALARPRWDTSMNELRKLVFFELASSGVEERLNHASSNDSSGKSDTNLVITGIRAVEAQMLLIGTLWEEGKHYLGPKKGLAVRLCAESGAPSLWWPPNQHAALGVPGREVRGPPGKRPSPCPAQLPSHTRQLWCGLGTQW